MSVSLILWWFSVCVIINPLNAELNPIRHLLALVGARHIVHVSRIRVNTRLCLKHDLKKINKSGPKPIPKIKFQIPSLCLLIGKLIEEPEMFVIFLSALYVGYSDSKDGLRISLAHPPDCHFAHVQ